ncbi:sugar transferase, partial [Patescibacteria group bacterium]|nr:sugar transferase [Patescibacteria group bacterium]
RIELFYSFITLIVDIFILLGIFLSSYYFRYSFNPFTFPYGVKIDLKEYLSLLFLLIPVWIAIFFSLGVYRLEGTRKIFSELSSIFWAVTFSVVMTTTIMFILRDIGFSRLMLIYIWILALLAFSLFRILFFYLRRYLVRFGWGVKRVLIIGQNEATESLKQFFAQNPGYGYRAAYQIKNGRDLKLTELNQLIKNYRLNQIIQGESSIDPEKNLKIMRLAQEKQLIFSQIPTLYELRKGAFKIETIGEVPLLCFRRTPLDGWGRIIKRVVDFILALLALIILLPFFLIIALIIKLDSAGSVFFRQKRVAKGGYFYLFKFRSMVDEAEKLKKKLMHKNERKEGILFKIKNDPRVTRVGRVLRQTRIDELPQLINVLKGEISLVGPRPHLPSEVKRYKKRHRIVLLIKPGITGMAQVSGASDLSFEDEVKLDAYYIENWSLFLDFIILIKTIGVVLRGQGAV